MKPYSSGIGAKLKAELGGLSREAFALKCLHSLQAVYIHPLQSMAVRGIVAMLDDKAQSEIKERCSDYNLLGLIEADGHRSPPLNDACQ